MRKRMAMAAPLVVMLLGLAVPANADPAWEDGHYGEWRHDRWDRDRDRDRAERWRDHRDDWRERRAERREEWREDREEWREDREEWFEDRWDDRDDWREDRRDGRDDRFERNARYFRGQDEVRALRTIGRLVEQFGRQAD